MKKQLIHKHHKVGATIIAVAILLFIISFILPPLTSYFIVAGIALLLLGLFTFDPSLLTF
jgi:accessory gene regulator protein AgrB